MQTKTKRKAKGLGDIVESIIEVTNIKKCQGCENRKQWLNIHFPFNKPNILTDEQIAQIETDPLQVYNDAFNSDIQIESFTGGVKKAILKKLNKLAEYEN